VDELQSLLDDSDSELLLTVVSALHHEGVEETLDNGAVHLVEGAALVSAGGEGVENLSLNGLHVQVSHQRDVLRLDALVGPSSKELDFGGVLHASVLFHFRFYMSKMLKSRNTKKSFNSGRIILTVSHLLYNQIFPIVNNN